MMVINNQDDYICLPKDMCILNTLAVGVAVQILAKITGETIEAWKDYIEAEVNKQYRQLSAEEIQQTIDQLKNLNA